MFRIYRTFDLHHSTCHDNKCTNLHFAAERYQMWESPSLNSSHSFVYMFYVELAWKGAPNTIPLRCPFVFLEKLEATD